MKNSSYRILCLALLFWAIPVGGSPSPEEGAPYLRHFPPREIHGGPQILSSVRDPRGLLYFAANRSILIYDGVLWRQVRTGTPRRLAAGPDGRVWVGCDGDFGYLEEIGSEIRFLSLRERLPEEDRPIGQVVGAEILHGRVHFIYRRQVVVETASGFESHPVEGEVEATAVRDGVLFLSLEGYGPVSWPDAGPGGGPVLLAVGERVSSLAPLGDDLLVGTSEGRLLRRRSSGETETFSPSAERRLEGEPVWSLLRLSDGAVAVASRGSGFLRLSPEGRVLEHLTEAAGLPGREIYTAVEDDQGGLWLGTSPGIVRVSDAPVSYYHGAGDGPKSLLSLARHEGRLFLGSIEGGYRLEPSDGPEPARFEAIEGLSASVGTWASTPHGLLSGGREGVFEIRGLRAEPVSREVRAVAWSETLGAAVAATEGLVRVLLPEPRDDGGVSWRFVDHPDLLAEPISEVVHDGEAFWLVTVGTRNLYRLGFDDGPESPPTLIPFETHAPWPRPLGLKDGLRIVDRDRVVFFDPRAAGLVEDDRFRIGEWRLPGVDRFELKALGNGDVWAGLRDRLVGLEEADGAYEPGDRVLGLETPLTFDMRRDPTVPDVLWLSTEVGPARFETRRLQPATADPRIRFLPPGELLPVEYTPGEPVARHSREAFRFEISLPFYRAQELQEYRFRLVGLSEAWSEWTTETDKEYTNLPGGSYRFEVQARHAGRLLGQAAQPFRVLPPWHQTWWARGIYVLVLAALLWTAARVQRRKLERERAISERERQVSRRLRNLDQLKDEFLANTSHELRTPLQGIAGLADSLLDDVHGRLPERVRVDLRMLLGTSRRLSTLVDDILDFSRLRHQGLSLVRRPVDLRPLVEVVLYLTRPLLKNKAVRLINSVTVDLPPVDADENRLQQVLHNLVGNAVKRTDQGTIEVSAEARDDQIWVRVLDTGSGISESHRALISEASEPAETKHAGSEFFGPGLGLSISRRLVELHGGTLELESTSEDGTVFAFSLPVARQSPAEPASEPRVVVSVREGPAEIVPGDRPAADADADAREARKILVVDDEPISRSVVSNHLTSWGYEVVEAEDGPTALHRLESRMPDLILLDVMMPRMSGHDVCRRIRRTYSLHQLPIIFLTGRAREEDLTAGYSSGANDFLVKPVSKQELQARVETHLELAHMHRHLKSLVEERTAQLKVLKGMLPICASCKKIRDDHGSWREVETYIRSHSEAEFSHGYCPDCYERLRAEIG